MRSAKSIKPMKKVCRYNSIYEIVERALEHQKFYDYPKIVIHSGLESENWNSACQEIETRLKRLGVENNNKRFSECQVSIKSCMTRGDHIRCEIIIKTM